MPVISKLGKRNFYSFTAVGEPLMLRGQQMSVWARHLASMDTLWMVAKG